MAKRMLIDANHPEETRVVVLDGNRLEEFDFESSTKRQVKGNIYLAKVTRVEPSLQAAFVDYGGNRHGFLPFSEIHPDYYKIPVGDRRPAAAAREDRETEPPPEEADEEAGVSLEAALPEAIQFPFAMPGGVAASASSAEGDISEGEILVEEAEAELEADMGSADGGFSETREFDREETPEGVASGPEERPNGEAETAEADNIETLGGDEIEEVRRPRPLRHYKIQEVIKRRQIMLVQVSKEERGAKGAALTTYLSLAGRYCVLMPNTARGGGISRKITSLTDRRRLKEIVGELEIPEGMGVIVRTAGNERSKAEIKRDYEYLLRLWNEIRELTLRSTAPALVHEEGNLIKRSIRDLYARDIGEVLVEGEEGYRTAKAFMKMLMPSHARRVQPYRDPQIGLLHRYQVEGQIDAIHSPIVQLRSGGTVVFNQTEALVAIDVNSGRATRERNIEETALRTNLEAAEEIARQLRLRDLAGLIVIDFIDMEEHRNQGAVERRLKEALRSDRARIQVGRISPFGLLEMSRQRLRPSLAEASTQPCPLCAGTGTVRSTESTALHVLRSIEEEGMRRRSAEICVYVPTAVALYILNQKRASLVQIEARYGIGVTLARDDSLIPPAFRLERLRPSVAGEAAGAPAAPVPAATVDEGAAQPLEPPEAEEEVAARESSAEELGDRPRRRRRRRRRRSDEESAARPAAREPADEFLPGARGAGLFAADQDDAEEAGEEGGRENGADEALRAEDEGEEAAERNRRRRGRRGGRRRGRREEAADRPRNGPLGEPVHRPAVRGPGRSRMPRAAAGRESAAANGSGGDAAADLIQGPDSLADAVEILPASEEREEPFTFEPAPAATSEPAGRGPSEAMVDAEGDRDIPPPESRQGEGGSLAEAKGETAGEDEEPPATPAEPPAEPTAEPAYPVLTVTERPAHPRKGWWQRLISAPDRGPGQP